MQLLAPTAHHRRRSLFVAVLLALACTACRVEIDVRLTVDDKGAGTIVVAAEADQELLALAPNLASELRFDDAVAAGWVVAAPTPSASGGLQISLSHPFASVEEATQLLASINGPDGPLRSMVVSRATTDKLTTVTVNGTALLNNGTQAFIDPDLLAIVGAQPFATEIATRGLNPADTIGVNLHLTLPGTITSTNGIDTDGVLGWTVPLIGEPAAIVAISEQTDKGNIWARPLATGSMVALIAWCAFAVLFILAVMLARHRRQLAAQRRRRN